jgi:hypothetical protein
MLPLAHAGHWAVDLLIYGSPVLIGFLAIKYVDRKEKRREQERERAGGPPPR